MSFGRERLLLACSGLRLQVAIPLEALVLRATLITILASVVIVVISKIYFVDSEQSGLAVTLPAVRGNAPAVPALDSVPQTGPVVDKLMLPNQIVLDEGKELFSDASADATPDFVEWARDFYNNPSARVPTRRYRFVATNYESLFSELEMSPAYVAVMGGQTPPPVYADSRPTFTLTLFDDRQIGLLVTDVRFSGVLGERHVIMRGEIRGGGSGDFKLSLTEGGQNLRGQIDTPSYHTRVDTFRISDVTVIAEFDRNDMESAHVAID